MTSLEIAVRKLITEIDSQEANTDGGRTYTYSVCICKEDDTLRVGVECQCGKNYCASGRTESMIPNLLYFHDCIFYPLVGCCESKMIPITSETVEPWGRRSK